MKTQGKNRTVVFAKWLYLRLPLCLRPLAIAIGYRMAGCLFQGYPHYEDWRLAKQQRVDTQFFSSDTLVHQSSDQPILKPIDIACSLPKWDALIKQTQLKSDINYDMGLKLVIRQCFKKLSYSALESQSLVNTTQDMGYAVLGPLIVSFCHWLIQKAADDNITHVYFLARDGLLIKQVYDRLTRVMDGPDSSYLVTSRRSVSLPSIESIEDIYAIAEYHFSSNSIKFFLNERFGLSLNRQQWKEIYRRKLWKRNKYLEVRGDIESIKPLLRYLEPEIMKRSLVEKPAMMDYLQSMGLGKSGRPAVVDIGYAASTQNGLMRLLNYPIQGYYMITSSKARKISTHHHVLVRGCFHEGVDMGKPLLPVNQYYKLEKLLVNSDSTQLMYYQLSSDNITCRKSLVPVFREKHKNTRKNQRIRCKIQQGLDDFVNDYLSIRENRLHDFNFPTELAARLFESMMTNISKFEESILRGLLLDDYYGGRKPE